MAGDFISELNSGIRTGVCNFFSNPAAYFFFVRAASRIPNPALLAAGAAAFYFRGLCNEEPPPAPPPPFDGGQCQIQYSVFGGISRSDGLPPEFPNWIAISYGPISTDQGPFIGPPPRRDWFFRVRDQFGNFDDRTVRQALNGEPVGGPLSSNDFTCGPILSVAARNNLPDNCGDPPFDPPPPFPPGGDIINVKIDYTDNSGQDRSLDLGIKIYSPRFNAIGNFYIPIGINLGGITFNGSLDLGGVTIGGPGNGGKPEPGDGPGQGDPRSPGAKPGLPGDYAPQPDPNTPKPPEPAPDPGGGLPEVPPPKKPGFEKVLRGVLVTVTKIGGRPTEIFQEENPTIFAPRLGNVQFFCRADTESLLGGWTGDIPVKNVRHLIECPWPGGAVSVEGTPEPGVEWELTPVYLLVESPIEDLTEIEL